MEAMFPNDPGLRGADEVLVLGKPLPVSPGSVSAPGCVARPAQTASAHALRILILEDKPTDAELMQRAMRDAGLDFTARRVDTRADFIAALETFAPDIVLADYRLPGFNGAEALAHVRHGHPEVPVVVVSGVLGDEAAIELLKAGAKDYVLKGNLLRLPPAVERAIAVEQGIRARKAAERALRATNSLLQTVERIAHTGGFDWDIASGTIVWSEETYRMFGRVPGEFLPSIPSFVDCIHPDDRGRVREAIDASVTLNQPFDAEFRILRPDKAERIIQSRGEISCDETGQPSRMTGTSQDITDRKLAEDTIREDGAKFRSLVEQNVAGIFIIRQDGTIGYVNPFFASLLGYQAVELIGRPLLDFIPVDRKVEVRKKLGAQLAGDAEFVQQNSGMQTRDGRTIEVLVNASRSIFEGRPASLAVVLDVTERNKAQRELASTAAILAAEHDVSPDGIVVVDASRSIISWNRQFVEMWDFPAEIMASKSEGQVFAWAMRNRIADPAASVAQMEGALAHPDQRSHHEATLTDGRVFDIHLSPMTLPGGGPVGRVWFFRDITERMRSEDNLRSSEERFRLLVEEAPDAILLYDIDRDHLIAANKAAERLFGCSRKEIVKHGPQHFYAPEQPDAKPVTQSFAEHNASALAGEELIYERRILNGLGQERLCQVTLVQMPSPGQRLLRASFIDITDRKEAERALAFERTILATEHELSPDGILVVDKSATIVSCNRRFGEIMNVPPELLAARQDEPVLAWVTDHMADPEGFLSRVRYLNEHLDENSFEEIVLKDGRVLDRYSMPMRLAESDYLGRVWFFRDISDRKGAERTLQRLNRTLRTLSRANEALVRATSEPELLTEMCRVIVETGGYRMAWVGIPEEDGAKSVTPVAWAGEVGQYLETARITWADEARGRGPHGRAIRSGEAQVTQDLGADPAMAPWQDAAKERGFASSVVLPLRDASGVFAALTIDSSETRAFDTDELKLLQELADDLAFGIRSLRDRRAHETLDQRWRTSLEATVGAIANTVEMRDPYTSGHQQRVARLAVAMAREMRLSEHQIQGLYLAGIIHDVGKIDIPSDILNKPGKLSKLQYQLIQGHAQAGYDIVKGVDFPWPIAQMVRQHHERLDGSGYPQGLKGEEILPEARILAVADVVEAMMSHRPYRAALGIDAALAEIEQGRGRLFDPEAVDACIALFRQRGFGFE
jgi:PAS domain S-box-containing protein